ncbi:hypothetical protein L839_2929 [Mycobacterium avium MAV_120809_2495]|nr:hypothetical protein O982_10035 [Mycobacterium avium 10-5581]ETZ48816.1 hypothetical protein L839_2929 [Mycobacterium avium MAV_120809_2495]
MMHRGPLIVFAAVVCLAGGLLALRFPVFIDAYDQFGLQVKCGSGFTTDLTQAASVPRKPRGQPSNTGNDYVSQCNEALLMRRAWAIPTTVLGGVTLTAAAGAALAHDRRRSARTETCSG